MSSPGQVGYPAFMNTDAILRHSVKGYQSAALAFQSCDARRSLLVCLEGKATRGHPGGKKDLAKRAKVGCSPRCTTLSMSRGRSTFLRSAGCSCGQSMALDEIAVLRPGRTARLMAILLRVGTGERKHGTQLSPPACCRPTPAAPAGLIKGDLTQAAHKATSLAPGCVMPDVPVWGEEGNSPSFVYARGKNKAVPPSPPSSRPVSR